MDQNVYSENLHSLEKKDSDLFALMKETPSPADVFVGDSANGEKFLAIEKEDKVYAFSSTYNPTHEAERFVNGFADRNNLQLLVCFGFANGKVIRDFLREKKSLEECVIYEPSVSLFRKALEVYDLRDIFSDTRVRLIVGDENSEKFSILLDDRMDYANWEYSEYICLPKYNEVYENREATVFSIYMQIRRMRWVDQNSLVYYSEQGTQNEIYSFKWLIQAKNFFNLKGKIPSNVPCIIIAAGPALEKNVDELKRAQGKAFLFAVDSVLPLLERKGIRPDMICTVDPHKTRRLNYVLQASEGIPLIFSPDCDYHLMNQFETGEYMCFSAGNGYFQSLFKEAGEDIPFFDGGGSVATCCFKLAYEIGFRTIVIIGQNLALEGDQLHAGEKDEEIVWDRVEVEGYYGGTVQSLADFKMYLDWYERIIPRCRNCRVINSTEGGAKIHGAEQMPLSEVIDELCTVPFDFQSIYQTIPNIWRTEESKRKLIRELFELRDYLDNLAKKIKSVQIKYREGMQKYSVGDLSDREADRLNAAVGEIMREIAEGKASLLLFKRMIKTELEFRRQAEELEKKAQKDDTKAQEIMLNYLTEGYLCTAELKEFWDDVLAVIKE